MENPLRSLPSVQALLEAVPGPLQASLPYAWLRDEARAALADWREELRAGEPLPDRSILLSEFQARLTKVERTLMQPVINATGVLVHTNLGRAPLASHVLAQLAQQLQGYANLEFDLESGQRGARAPAVERLISTAAGTEAALVVNNNAAAVLLILGALAPGKDVIVSRGELVEIGGGFRVPEVIEQSGCHLVEVGTTNKTRRSDYEKAIGENTGVLLKVHPSNFRIEGFTEQPSRQELLELAEEHGLWFVEDLGSGAFWAPPTSGHPEPLVNEVAGSCHVVTFSGDKLLGGPQAGILAGRAAPLALARRHPLFRALRADKLHLFLLQELFRVLLNQQFEALPLHQMAYLSAEEVKRRAQNWVDVVGAGLTASLQPCQSTMGGGSLPEETIPSWAAVVQSSQRSATSLQQWLRDSSPPIIGRIEGNALWLDPRTVLPEQDQIVAAQLAKGVIPC